MRRRYPIIAALLTFICFGLGHVYAGRSIRGFKFFSAGVIGILVLFTLGLSEIKTTLFLLVIFAVITSLFFIYTLIDAYLSAKAFNKSGAALESKYTLQITLLMLIFVLFSPIGGIYPLVKKDWLQAFKIPTGAMEPTLLVGDYLLVKKLGYQATMPKRGELVVFKYPLDHSLDYVKRCVATNGDTVEMRDKVLYINNIYQDEPYVQHIDPKVRRADNRWFDSSSFSWQYQYLTEEAKAKFKGRYQPTRDNFGPIVVPVSHYFCLGDNRDSSADSRFWGFVPEESTVGKPIKFYWPPSRIGPIE